jgi:hypothetical protein
MTNKHENAIINMQEYVTNIPKRLNTMHLNEAFTGNDDETIHLAIKYCKKLSDALLMLIPNTNSTKQ